MSWLVDLAGKAEDFLNKVDQSAASALKKDEQINGKGYQDYVTSIDYQSAVIVPVESNKLQQNPKPTYSKTSSQKFNSEQVLPSSPKTCKSKDDDEKLLEFLNMPGPQHVKHKQSMLSRIEVQESIVLHPKDTTKEVQDLDTAQDDGNMEEAETPMTDSMMAVLEENNSQNVNSECESTVSQVSSLEIENRLLMNEVSSLNQEMVQVLQRAKDSESDQSKLKETFEYYNTNASQTDRIIKQLQDREQDLQQALSAKDSQLAVLRVRLQEADQELQIKRELLQKLDNEKERILKDHNDSSGLQSQVLQSLQDKINDTEMILQREKSQFKLLQMDYTQRLDRLEDDQKQLSATLSESHKALTEEKSRSHDLAVQLRTVRSSLDISRQDLTDYKQKAQKILQSKEKVIANLKGATNFNSGDQEYETVKGAIDMELEELRQERESARDELHQSNSTIEQLQNEVQNLGSQFQSDMELLGEQRRNAEEQLQIEIKMREELQHEGINLKEEMQYLREELLRQKTMLQSRIQDRDGEIEKLRKQVTVKMMNNSQCELEARLHALTESLIQKQTMLEVLSTEKSSLVLQLERLEQQVNESQSIVRRGNSTAVHLPDDSDAKGRVPGFLLENPFDSRVARKIKRAYNTIDTFSVRLGVFLRRYPIARILVIVYMFLLHLWVMVVLLTSMSSIQQKPTDPSRK